MRPIHDPNLGVDEVRDGLSVGRARGRGAGLNPGNRFESHRLHVLGSRLEEAAAEHPDGVQVRTTVLDDETRTILNEVDSPDLNFKWTLNPYRGCEHGCIYCYARPGHEYLGLSSGLDFETRIFAKPRAPELLRAALRTPSWTGEPIVMSGVTDPYQPTERERGITRACLEVMLEARQSVAIITKSRLVVRDLDLLREMNRYGGVHVAISITTLDNELASAMEPRASAPAARLGAVRELAAAGIPVQVMAAPIIPGLNDREIPAILRASAKAGPRRAGYILLRLPHQIKDLFLDWLRRTNPARAAHVEALIRDTRAGDLYSPGFYTRMRGEGAVAEQISQVFRVFRRRFHLDSPLAPLNTAAFRRPEARPGQMRLFAG